jgi:alkylation response protein AidB-like acyl-CoA dehydrogenase
MNLIGPAAMLVEDGYALSELQRVFLESRAETIYGGASEIQRNIVGERILGLPREPR